MARTTRISLGLFLPVLLASACTVGPDYKKPEVPVPPAFRAEIAAPEAASFADLPWWNVFDDSALHGLITEALANNNDLQVAVARIEQARALVTVAQSEGRPQVGYQGSVGGERAVNDTQRGAIAAPVVGSMAAVIDATWEFDIWGRIQHATDAARANLLAQEDVRHAVILTLVSDLATSYFQLIELDKELSIATESARVYKNTLDLFNSRFVAGKDSNLPVQRAQSAYDSSSADIQNVKRQIAQLEDAISVLVGAYPKPIDRGRTLTDQVMPETPVGSTTALLQRRPDISQAEQNMIAANAEIGVAVADFFPKIGLSLFFGGQGVTLAQNTAAFGIWSAALGAAGPIFSGGRLEATYHQSQAYWDETVAQYKQKVLHAFMDTSDALAARQTLALRKVALQSQVAALQRSSELALLRYDSGRASYFEVLEAQQQLFPAQNALAQTERDQLVAVVDLYKALGGGWDAADDAQAPKPVASAIPAADKLAGK